MSSTEYVKIDIGEEEEHEYNKDLVLWVSAGRPNEGTWKLYAENQIFSLLLRNTENIYNLQFNLSIKTIAAKRILSFSLILKSSEEELNHDICGIIANNIMTSSITTIRDSEKLRQDRLRYHRRRQQSRQPWGSY